MVSFVKDPDATLNYAVDWSQWLGTGESIAASEWQVQAGITKETDSFTDSVATILLSGGVVGTNYDILNRITTSFSNIDDRTFTVRVRER